MQPYVDFLKAHTEQVDRFRIDALDRAGVPVVNASAWGPTPAFGVGYGATEAEAARSAYGECVENLGAARYAERVEPVELTVEEALARGALDPSALSLVAGSESPIGELLWVPGRRLDGSTCLVPLEAAVTSAAEWKVAAGSLEPLFPPITNGQGAAYAGDEGRAVRHGLLELLQRDLNWWQFKALDTGRAVPVDDLLELPFPAVLKYAGQAFGVHSFHASAADPDPDLSSVARTATGEGADPDPRVAARKALLELCASRCRKQFFFSPAAMAAVAPAAYRERAAVEAHAMQELGWDLPERFDALLADSRALQRVVDRITHVAEWVRLPPAYPSSTPLERLAPRVVVIDMTQPGDAAYVAKVIVPGLEAEVLSHHRIGARAVERLLQRLPEVVHLGNRPGPGWKLAGGAWIDVERLTAIAEDFLALYREPYRHTYSVPEAERAA